VIHDFEPRLFAEIVNAGDVQQVIEQKIVSTELRDVAEVACCDCVRRFATKFSSVLKFLAEGLA
jgi:hypothetical protein